MRFKNGTRRNNPIYISIYQPYGAALKEKSPDIDLYRLKGSGVKRFRYSKQASEANI